MGDAARKRAAAIVLIAVIGVPAVWTHGSSGSGFGNGMLDEQCPVDEPSAVGDDGVAHSTEKSPGSEPGQGSKNRPNNDYRR
jgi:hypothetical protein